jgi:hypothetical protein
VRPMKTITQSNPTLLTAVTVELTLTQRFYTL